MMTNIQKNNITKEKKKNIQEIGIKIQRKEENIQMTPQGHRLTIKVENYRKEKPTEIGKI
jgi:hypothetical protein